MISFFRIVIFIPVLFWLSSVVGLEGVALAVLSTSIVMFVVDNAFIYLKLKISIGRLISVHIRPVLSSFMVFIVAKLFQTNFSKLFQYSEIFFLIVTILLGALTYVFITLLLWKISGCPSGPEKNVLESIFNRN